MNHCYEYMKCQKWNMKMIHIVSFLNSFFLIFLSVFIKTTKPYFKQYNLITSGIAHFYFLSNYSMSVKNLWAEISKYWIFEIVLLFEMFKNLESIDVVILCFQWVSIYIALSILNHPQYYQNKSSSLILTDYNILTRYWKNDYLSILAWIYFSTF